MTLTPEFASLFAILRSRPDAPDPEVPSAPEWDTLCRLAAQTEIIPVLYAQARCLPTAQQPPSAVAERLYMAYLHACAHSARLFYEYGTVAGALHHAQIPFMPLKGIHLAARTYTDPALRLMGDIDLLVYPEHLERIETIMGEVGYRRFGTPLRDDPHQRHEKYQAIGRAPIEFHWDLGHYADQRARRVDMPGIWARADAVEIEGVPTHVLSPVDAFTCYGLHIYAHGFRVGLRRLIDLREIVRATPEAIAPDLLWPQAAAWRLTRPIAVLCEVLRDWLHVTIPDIPGTHDVAQRDAVYAAQQDLLTTDEKGTADHVVRLLGAQRWHDKAKVALRQLFPARVTMAERYGDAAYTPRIYGLYAARCWQALCKYGPFSSTYRPVRSRARFLDWLDAE